MKEETGLVAILTAAIALITYGVSLIEKGEYETGILIVVLGIVLLTIYMILSEKIVIGKVFDKVGERLVENPD